MQNNFDWAWAEIKEREEALQAFLQSFYEEEPLYELFWITLQSPPCDISGYSFDFAEASELITPEGFPNLMEPCHLLDACCQNKILEHALFWLSLCLEKHSFSAATLSKTLADGCWRGWFLEGRNELAQKLIDAGANVDHQSMIGETPLLSLFRALDEPSEQLFSGSLGAICDVLLKAGASPKIRNKAGVSPLSRINERLSETLIGMMDNMASTDYLFCARLLLDCGADPLSVREQPPLESLIAHEGLLGMIQGEIERTEIDAYLKATLSHSAQVASNPITAHLETDSGASSGITKSHNPLSSLHPGEGSEELEKSESSSADGREDDSGDDKTGEQGQKKSSSTSRSRRL